jgi:hypothetical protein
MNEPDLSFLPAYQVKLKDYNTASRTLGKYVAFF